MIAVWPANPETVNDRSDICEPFMRWFCSRNAPRDIELMIGGFLVSEIAMVDFDNYVTRGPPLLTARMLEVSVKEDSSAYRLVSLASHTVEQLPHPSFTIISYF